jgi:hypothetical protein
MRVNHDFESFGLRDLTVVVLIDCQDCFVSAEEIVDPGVILLESLEGIGGQLFLRVLVLINVSNLDLVIVIVGPGHYEVLLNGCRQDRISTVINVLSDDVYPTWSSEEIFGGLSVETLKSCSQVFKARFMLGFDCPISLVVKFCEMV